MRRFIYQNKKIIFTIADALAVAASVYLAFFLRFEGAIPARYFDNIFALAVLSLAIFLPIFHLGKLYSFTWSYVSAAELISLTKTLAIASFALGTALLVLRDYQMFTGFPRSTLVINVIFVFILSGSIRLAKRIYLQAARGVGKEKEKILIVGAGDAGEQLLRSILSSKQSPYFPIGFVDDHDLKQGSSIHGSKVLGKIGDIPQIIKAHDIREGTLIIALPSAGSRIIRQAVELGREAGLKKIKIIPPIGEIIGGQVSINALREVGAEDLLGREPVSLDQKMIEDSLFRKTVLITGAAGSIGSELSRQVAKFGPSLLALLDQDETGIFNISKELEGRFPALNIVALIADVQDKVKVENIFGSYPPQIVFHAAAYKHVPLMEDNADEAVKNNIFGTKIVAEAALKRGTEKFIFISTDKAVNPASVMGATKRIGEMICQSFNKKRLSSGKKTKFISVRFGNVLDSRGSVIPIFREQIKKMGPVEITHPDMKRYFMTTPEACLLVMQAGAMGRGGEVFVLDMGEPIKIVDLARALIRLSGFEPDKDIPIVFTQPRPGEKFFEDFLMAEEGAIPTSNKKIFIAQLSDVNGKRLNSKLKKIKTAAMNNDKSSIIKSLKEVVSTYGQTSSREKGKTA